MLRQKETKKINGVKTTFCFIHNHFVIVLGPLFCSVLPALFPGDPYILIFFPLILPYIENKYEKG